MMIITPYMSHKIKQICLSVISKMAENDEQFDCLVEFFVESYNKPLGLGNSLCINYEIELTNQLITIAYSEYPETLQFIRPVIEEVQPILKTDDFFAAKGVKLRVKDL